MSAAPAGGRWVAPVVAVLLALAAYAIVGSPEATSAEAWTLPAGGAARPAPAPSPSPLLAVDAAVEIEPLGGRRSVGLRLELDVAAECAETVLVALLRRSAFAPRVRLDEELWRAWRDGAEVRVADRAAQVFDRLARLGYQKLDERSVASGSVAGDAVEFAAPLSAAACLAVGVGLRTVGYVDVAGGGVRRLPLVAAGEFDVGAPPGEAWAWSDCDFPGPHRAGVGQRLPAARAYTLVLCRGETTTVRYFEPSVVPAEGVARGRFAPSVHPGSLPAAAEPGALVHTGPGHRGGDLALGTAAAGQGVEVRLEGNPFGSLERRSLGGGGTPGRAAAVAKWQ